MNVQTHDAKQNGIPAVFGSKNVVRAAADFGCA